MGSTLLWLLIVVPWLPVGLGVAKLLRVRAHRRHVASELVAAPVAYHQADRTAAVRVGAFHACAAPSCGLRRPHPCHDISCPKRAAGTCSPIHIARSAS